LEQVEPIRAPPQRRVEASASRRSRSASSGRVWRPARALHQPVRARRRWRCVRERCVQQHEQEIVLAQPLRDLERARLRLRLARLELEHAAKMRQRLAGARERADQESCQLEAGLQLGG
jgi:hypothetical protein